MPRKKGNSARDRKTCLAAVRSGLSKAVSSGTIRNPADDVQAMDVDECEQVEENKPRIVTTDPLEPESGYCNYCGCRAETLRRCSGCRAIVCEQSARDAPGCIHFMSGVAADFLCPHCARTALQKEYGFWGYGGRKHAKMTWPLVFVDIRPLGCVVDPHLRKSVELDLVSEYTAQPGNLVVADVGMKVGGTEASTAALGPAVNFIRRSTDCGWPANVLVVLQSRSNPVTGALLYGVENETPAFATIPAIFDTFLGLEMKAAMSEANENAISKASDAVKAAEDGWFQFRASSRGGWRGAILLTGGPTIRVQVAARKDEAISLVEGGLFDFVVAFTSHTVVPSHARAFVSSMVRAMAVDNATEAKDPNPPSIWAAFIKAVKSCPVVLESSSLVLIFKERGMPTDQRAESRQVAFHNPPFNAWGVQFRSCGRGCDVVPSDITFRRDKGAIRCQCILCGWKSCRVKQEDMADLVANLSPDLPSVFWHAYPPSPHLLDAFGRFTKGYRE